MQLSEKQLAKIKKILGPIVTEEFSGKTPEELRASLETSLTNINQAQAELEANPKYVALKEQLNDLTSGLRDVKKFQNAKIQLAIHLLNGESTE